MQEILRVTKQRYRKKLEKNLQGEPDDNENNVDENEELLNEDDFDPNIESEGSNSEF